MQDQRNVYAAANLLQALKVQFWPPLVQAVRCADRHGKAVNARVRHIADGIIGVRIGAVCIRHDQIVLLPDQLAKLRFDRSAAGMREGHDLLYLGDIFLIGEAGRIDHHAAAARCHCRLDFLYILMMIQMERHRNVIFFHSRAGQGDQVILVGIADRRRSRRNDDRRTHLMTGIHDDLKGFQIVNIERRYRVMIALRVAQHRIGVM